MPTVTANLVTRDDTLLGICEGLGEEFGFHANYLRVTLAALLLWNAAAIVGLYLAAGAVLMLCRWAMPVRQARDDRALPAPVADNDEGLPVVAQAA